MSNVYELCSKHFSNRAQLIKVLEELGEVVQAIAKYLVATEPGSHPDEKIVRPRGSLEELELSIIRETCDGEAMLKQIEYIFEDQDLWKKERSVVTANLWRKLREVTGIQILVCPYCGTNSEEIIDGMFSVPESAIRKRDPVAECKRCGTIFPLVEGEEQ